MRLRPWIAACTLGIGLTLFLAARGDAQTPGRLEGGLVTSVYTGSVRSVNFYGTGGSVSAVPSYPTYASGISGYVPPYSYYAAIPPMQPRTYVGYGNDAFPYYGRPYGHPNDRWSWEALSSGNTLARYYYPPVR